MKKGSAVDKMIKAIAHLKDVTPSDLKKYQIVIIGSNVGGALTKNLSHFTHGHKSMFNICQERDLYFQPFRIYYELQKFNEINGKMNTDMVLCQSVGRSNMIPAEKIDAKNNRVFLENGREIEYDTLVLSNGIGQDLDFAPGFRACLEDSECPVYTTVKSGKKVNGFLQLFQHGNCFIYIPPFPFSGEIECYNFLVGLSLWNFSEKIGLVSPKRKITIVNANDRFASHSKLLNDFILKELSKYDVEILYNTQISSFDKDNRKLSLKKSNGETWSESFHNVYVHLPNKKSNLLSNSGLSADNVQVNVNRETLLLSPEVNPNNNIFGLGDVSNVPIQRSLYSGFAQNHVVRHNVLQILKNKSINATYDGYTSMFLHTGLNEAVGYKSTYGNESVNDMLRFLQAKILYNKFYYGTIKKVYAGKHAGPPKFKLGYPKWKDPAGEGKTEKSAH